MAVETVVRNNLRWRAYTVIGGGMQVQDRRPNCLRNLIIITGFLTV